MKTFKSFINEIKKLPFQSDNVNSPITAGNSFNYHRRIASSKTYSKHLPKDAFDRHIEPHGRYMIHQETDKIHGPDIETGKHTFHKPLVINHGGDYGHESNWKQRLHKHYNKKGKALSKEIAKHYDGIVTISHHPKIGHHPSEIVDLSMFHKKD